MDLYRTVRRLTAEVLDAAPRQLAISVGLMALLTATEGVGLLLLMPLLNLVGINEPTTMPNVAQWFETGFALVGIEPSLANVLALFVSIAGLRVLLQRAQARVNASLREDLTVRVRLRLYAAIAAAEWKFLVTRRPSEFVNVLTGEVNRVGNACLQVTALAFTTAVSLVYLGMAFHFSPVMALLVLCCAAVLAWGARSQLEHARVWGARAAKARARLHSAITEHVASLKTARSYGVTDRHAAAFGELSNDLRTISLEVAAGDAGLQQSLEFASTLMLAAIVYVSFEVLGITAAQLLVLLFVFARLIPRLISVYRQVRGLKGVMPVLESIQDLERACLEAAEPVATSPEPVSVGSGVRFDRVWLSYPRRSEEPAVRDLTLEIPAGLTTAVVGPSGAGKSTLADLLIGLLTPTAGVVLVDGKPLSADRLPSWRQQISYVPQDTFLFHDTIRANLTWVRPEATDKELWDALAMAAVHDFVASLPQGLDTIIGERGILISGGERQRLSLARALVRRPQILVLDEATSSLDSENELQIQRAIESLHHQMTIIIITHRLSTIRGADLIHVLDRGRLAESGTWQDLMAKSGGRFRELCLAQGLEQRPAPLGADDESLSLGAAVLQSGPR